MTYRVRNIAIAGALAAAAVLFTALYVRDVRNDAQQGSALVSVLVAARDIVAGTPGSDAVEDDLLKTREVPRRSVVPGAISNAGQVEGLVASEQIYAGEQVTVRRFAPVAQQGILGKLSGNMRGLQVPGNQHQLLAGTLKEGDRVDVIASIKFRVRDITGPVTGADLERTASRVVLRDLLVLQAADAAASDSGLADSASTSLSVILAVTDSQAQKLFFVMKNGEWSLQLRPTNDPKDSPESVETVESVLGDGLKAGQRAQLVSGR
jgi:Flp pilus assembly protein CpaB